MVARWVYEDTKPRPTFLPAYLNRVGLVDITCINHAFRVFLDPQTGKVYDGNEYYKQHLEEDFP